MNDDLIIEKILKIATERQGNLNDFELIREVVPDVKVYLERCRLIDRIFIRIKSEGLLDVKESGDVTSNALSFKIKEQGGYLAYLENKRKEEKEKWKTSEITVGFPNAFAVKFDKRKNK